MRYVTAFFLFIFLLVINCSIQEPVMPRWVVPFVIPLSSEKLVFQDKLVNDSTIVLQGDSLFIKLDGAIDPQSITAADLTIPGKDTTTTFSLDTLRLDSLNNMTTGYIQLKQVLPFLQPLVGQQISMPETTLTANPKTLESGQFKAVKVDNGSIELTLHNDLPFTLGPNASSPNGVQIMVYNDSTNTLVANVYIPQVIPPGGIGTGTSPIGDGDFWVYSPLRLEYYLPIARDTSFLVTDSLLNATGYQLDVKMRELEVSEIIGKVQSQSFSDQWRISLDQDDKVIEAKVASGQIHLDFQNNLALGATLNFTLPDLITPSGQPYQDQLTISPNSTTHKDISLDGFTLLNHRAPGSPLDSLNLEFEVVTEETPGFVHVSASDDIGVSIQTSDLQFSYFKGSLARDTLRIDPFEEHNLADYDGFTGGIQFQGAMLKIVLDNQINMDTMLLDLDIKAYHRDKNGVFTDSAAIQIRNESVGLTGDNVILLDGPEISNLLNILPTDIRGAGQVVYGGVATVSQGDQIGGHYYFSTPAKLIINNPEPFKLDPDTLYQEDIDQDVRDAAGDDIQSAALHATVMNHSPLGGTVKIFVSADMQRPDLYDTTAVAHPDSEFVKTLYMAAGQVDPTSGMVQQGTASEVNFELNQQELRLFKKAPLRIGFLLQLDNTNGPVVVSGSDFIEISGKFEVNVLVQDKDN